MVTKSPYLRSEDRLADVIAAIQVMGTYKFYKLDFLGWSNRITGDSDARDHWSVVFREHPEFFKLNSDRDKSSLVIRRQHQKLYNVDREIKITREEFHALGPVEKGRISRTPLNSSEISALIETAIELHARALENEKAARWWLPVR